MDRARKRELRAINDRVWNGEKGLFPISSSLDSTLKKNTALIRRLRTAVSPATLNPILQDIRTLSLHKYLSEVISACYEGLCKLKSPGEIDAGVEIVSALHQRFGPLEFTESLGWLLGKGLATPDRSMLKALASEIREKEEKERIVRQRVLLRVVTELWLVGVLRTLDDVSRPDDATKGATLKPGDVKLKINSSQKDGAADPFPLEVLKDLLGHDREHVNLPLLVIFVKAFSWDVLGVRPAEGRKMVEEDGEKKSTNGTKDVDISDIPGDDQPLTPPELQERFKNVVKRYFDDLKAHLVRDQKSIHNQARRNAEVYVKAGEVFDDRQANYEKQVKAQERLVANAQIIADAVGAEMPNLKDADEALSASNGSIGLVKAGEYLRNMGDGAGIWEDEEERRFYENIIDLKGKVPPILLEDGKKKKGEVDDQTTKKADAADAADAAKPAEPAEDLSTSIANKTIGAQVDVILARLPDLNTKDAVDQTAVDFCFLNSKASRNRLIKALTDVPKGRSDLLPSWSRLAATLGRYMPDIPKALVDYLDAEFRSLQRRKEKEFLGQVRLSNIRYLAELTKFGVVPEHVVFHCLKVAIDDFSRMNIEIICNLLENCGRYLLRNADTSPRMATFLETLQRKKSVQHIGQPERMLIENAIYYVDPPSRPAIEQKERTPLDLFVRKLLYVDLTKRNYSRILKQIRRLHWEEVEVVAVLEKVFSRPGKIKYGNIHLLAVLLGALYRYHPDFVVRVVDKVIESINYGLEQNDFKFYQRRLAEVKYLSELYNYRMIEHPVIFDTIYKIATFGYDGLPVPGRINRFDMPDDFFRIRLIATVLETCGVFFSRGAAGKKLNSFLSFFQYYVYTKMLLPMDIEFIVQDTFALTRPQWKLAANLEEATQALQLAIAQDKKTAGLDKTQEGDDGSAATSSGDENMDPDMADAEVDGEESSASEDEEAEDVTNSDAERSVSSEEKIVVTRPEEEVDLDDEAEFQREYAKMMAESMESRKFERKPLFDLALPVRAKHKDTAASTEAGDGGAPSPVGTMSFALLTKKGNRQQTRKVEVPSDSTFAVAMMNQQQAEREEQQRIKNLVLNYDLRENEDLDGSEKPTSYHMNRMERPVKERGGQRSRKLQLSDVDWYEHSYRTSQDWGADCPKRDDERRVAGVAAKRGRKSNHLVPRNARQPLNLMLPSD